jgi:hypothetical protein
MKKSLIALLASILIISNVSAGDNEASTYKEPAYKTAIIDESLDFSAERDGNEVYLEWNSYEEDDFKYYKIMRSETHNNPVYPDQPAFKFLDDASQDSHEFKNWSTKSAVYRICVITTDNSRICSNTTKLVGYVNEKKEYNHEEKTYNKTEYIKKEVNKTEKLDAKLQARADVIVANLIKRLDDKYGTDNEAKVKRLSDLSTKLDKINDSIKSEKTKALVSYLVEALNKKKAEYGTSDDIEDIFNLLEK